MSANYLLLIFHLDHKEVFYEGQTLE